MGQINVYPKVPKWFCLPPRESKFEPIKHRGLCSDLRHKHSKRSNRRVGPKFMACRPEARGIPKVYHWFPLVFMVREDSHEMGAYPICKKDAQPIAGHLASLFPE